MRKQRPQLLATLALGTTALSISACTQIVSATSSIVEAFVVDKQDKKQTVTSERPIEGPVNHLDVGSAITVELHLSEENRMVIHAPSEERAEKLVTELRKGKLSIHEGDSKTRKRDGYITIEIYTPSVETVELGGASKLQILSRLQQDKLKLDLSGSSQLSSTAELKVSQLDLELSGASNVELKGSARDAKIDLSGASNLKGRDLNIERAKVDLSGASKATIKVQKDLAVELSGASKLEYSGSPSISALDVSGAASLHKR